MKYVLIDSTDIGIIDFTKVKENSLNTLRYNNDNSKTFVKYEGTKPDFIGDRTEYNREDFLVILSDESWQQDD
tara:strand:+ start:300 stop:518 length:219 start_codon:yes stop_codon:yes gene_type:complete